MSEISQNFDIKTDEDIWGKLIVLDDYTFFYSGFLEELQELRPEFKDAPPWYFKPKSALTFKPFVIPESDRRKFTVVVGNTGLSVYMMPNGEWEMHFKPNADHSRTRRTQAETLRNVGIWAQAFESFLVWKINHVDKQVREAHIINGETHRRMFEIRKRLLDSITDSSVKEFAVDSGNVGYEIELNKVIDKLSTKKSLFSQVSSRAKKLEDKIQMINPRLCVYDKDEKTGSIIYGL